MGSILGKQMKESMEENMRKSQEFMLDTQKLQMERQMNMQRLMFEKQLASQVSRAREMLEWLGSFYVLASTGMLIGFIKTKKPSVILPFVPLSFLVGYQAHLAYGGKIEKIRANAEKILLDERNLIALPGGPLTFESVEEARKSVK